MARKKCPRGTKLECVPKAVVGLGSLHHPHPSRASMLVAQRLGLKAAEMAFRISEGYTDARKAGGSVFDNSANVAEAAADAAWQVALREQAQGADFWNNFDSIQLGDEIGRMLAQNGYVNVTDVIYTLNRG